MSSQESNTTCETLSESEIFTESDDDDDDDDDYFRPVGPPEGYKDVLS